MVLAIQWKEQPLPHVCLLDQTQLPLHEVTLQVDTVSQLIDAIQRLAVRGAPALGAAGALGVVLALHQAEREKWSAAELQTQINLLREARPTAINLSWAVDHVAAYIPQGIDEVLTQALRILSEDEAANRTLSKLGADWIVQRTGKSTVRVITHCNTGALATSAWGTAYGIIHELHNRGSLGMVYADETRPLLQGSRLTSWELTKDGIDHVVQVDGAAASTILRGLVDVAIIGADRIARNGDTANKIGSVTLALACQRAGIPFIVAAPYSTVDMNTASGDDIVIEEREASEVLSIAGHDVIDPHTRIFNPAFDVTPHDLIDAIVTEHGVYEPVINPASFIIPTPIISPH